MIKKGYYFISYVVLKSCWGRFKVTSVGNISLYMEINPETDLDQVVAAIAENINEPAENISIISINKF